MTAKPALRQAQGPSQQGMTERSQPGMTAEPALRQAQGPEIPDQVRNDGVTGAVLFGSDAEVVFADVGVLLAGVQQDRGEAGLVHGVGVLLGFERQ